LVLVAILLLTPGSDIGVSAATMLHVDDDDPACGGHSPCYTSIQTAIGAALDGDTVLVAPGNYPGNLDFQGKAIAVTSEGGPEVTRVNGDQTDSVVRFASGEGSASVLSGFTIRGGRSTFDSPGFGSGGGLFIDDSSPTIVNNVISGNRACTGVGIWVDGGAPLIQGNTITTNFQDGCSGGLGGGGIGIIGGTGAQIVGNVISDNRMDFAGNGGGISAFDAGTPVIRGNVITGNTISGSSRPQGAGIWLVNNSDAIVVQNLITHNSAGRRGRGGGVYWQIATTGKDPVVVNNTIADNDAPDGSGIFALGSVEQAQLISNNVVAGSDGQTAVYCDVVINLNADVFQFNNVYGHDGESYGGYCDDLTGLNGNISTDPQFVDSPTGDYHLAPGSPSVDAGNNGAPYLTDLDFEGHARILDGDGDGNPVVDMGAYEAPTPAPTPTPTPSPPSIGGIVDLAAERDVPAEPSGSSATDHTLPVAAAVVGGALVALAAAGWYARRRPLR
jgi:serine protease